MLISMEHFPVKIGPYKVRIFTAMLILYSSEIFIVVLDSNGKIPAGILRGANLEFGFYDQCLDIMETIEGIELKGKYCSSGLMIPYANLLNPSQSSSLNLRKERETVRVALGNKLGKNLQTRLDLPSLGLEGILLISVCIPDQCTPSEVFGGFGIDSDLCETKGSNRKLDGGDIACV